jgi:uncharacterized protein (DUF433 family)
MAEKRIVSTPDTVSGQVRIKGTRIMVSVILDSLAEGMTPEQIVEDYPSLDLTDVQASLAYAAESARDQRPNDEDLAALQAFRRLQAEGPNLDEEEANRIAYDQLRAYRTERAAKAS